MSSVRPPHNFTRTDFAIINEQKERTMQMNPYLNFNGNCEAAFKFYEQCLGGTIVMMLTHGDAPSAEHVPSAWHKKIMYARLTVGDLPVGHKYSFMENHGA